ncbi:MAG: DegV family protein [Clostridia bacterium]|nr:DegV family protein [Clostridia bacterium]
MANVKIVTDSNCGITQAEAKKLGIFIVPMSFLIDGTEYLEGVELSQEEFYANLKSGATISTSQPSVASLTGLWEELLSDGSEIVHIPLSSGLSAACPTAKQLAKEYGGRVHVIDNQRVSLTQKESVFDAIKLAERGYSAAQIEQYLMDTKFDSSIYISLETLKYLKNGGRLTPAAALIGTILRIKPVLQIQGEKLDAFKKVQTLRQAKAAMIAAIRKDFETRFQTLAERGEMMISVAHTANEKEANIFMEEIKEAFPGVPVLYCDPLSLVLSCHIGPGALAVACARILK